MTGTPPGIEHGHVHAEAFCHMQYADKSGQVSRSIWNSRDGVTPFGCTDPETGAELLHVNWFLDRYDPTHVPAVGDLVWVDLNPERALQLAERQVDGWWDHQDFPMREQFGSKQEAAQVLVRSYFESVDAQGLPVKVTPPDLVVVTEFLRDQFAAEAVAR